MENYLSHYNILNSHWGIRRWQNKDGSLTPEGRIRYSKSKGKRSAFKIAKERKKQQDKEEKAAAKKAVEDLKKSRRETKPNYSPDYKKPVSEYTNEDLKAVNDRLKLEAEYKNKIKEITPKKVSKGKKIVDSLDTLNKGLNSAVGIYKNVNTVVATTNLLKKNLKSGK